MKIYFFLKIPFLLVLFIFVTFLIILDLTCLKLNRFFFIEIQLLAELTTFQLEWLRRSCSIFSHTVSTGLPFAIPIFISLSRANNPLCIDTQTINICLVLQMLRWLVCTKMLVHDQVLQRMSSVAAYIPCCRFWYKFWNDHVAYCSCYLSGSIKSSHHVPFNLKDFP